MLREAHHFSLIFILPANFLLVDGEIIRARFLLERPSVEVKHLGDDLLCHQAGQCGHGLLLVDAVQPPGVLVKISGDF